MPSTREPDRRLHHTLRSLPSLFPWPNDHSLSPVVDDMNRAGHADAQVDSRANQGQAEVVANSSVNLPALLDFLHPEQKQPGYDE